MMQASLKSNPHYARFIASPTLHAVDGVWDDHDFGINDGGKNSVPADQHAARQRLYLDFMYGTAP